MPKKHSQSLTTLIPKQLVVPMNSVCGAEAVFVIHPLEGMVENLLQVGALLKKPTYGLQCTLDVPQDSIQDIARYYAQEIVKVHPRGPYHICGYSFGALVAFEVALALQGIQKQLVRSLSLLDGSPEFMSIQAVKQCSRMEDFAKESKVIALRFFVLQFTDENSLKLTEELASLPSWEAQLDKVADMVMATSKLPYEKADVVAAAESYTKKLYASQRYVHSAKYEGNVTLIKASESVDMASCLDDQYGLGKMVTGAVDVHVVPGNHKSFIQGDSAHQVADILNEKITT